MINLKILLILQPLVLVRSYDVPLVKAEQSNTLLNDHRTADKAIDKLDSTHSQTFRHGSTTEMHPWLKVEFDKKHNVIEVEFIVNTHDKDIINVTLFDGNTVTGQQTSKMFGRSWQSSYIMKWKNSVIADKLEFRTATDTPTRMTIKSMNVRAIPDWRSELDDILVGLYSANQLTTYDDGFAYGYDASKAIDNDLNTMSHTLSESSWLEITFRALSTVSEVVIINRFDSNSGNFLIDGAKVALMKAQDAVQTWTLTYQSSFYNSRYKDIIQQTYTFNCVEMQATSVKIAHNTALMVVEVLVGHMPNLITLENATLSSSWPGSLGEYATDNNLRTLAHTNNDRNGKANWLEVQFRSLSAVRQVIIYNRFDKRVFSKRLHNAKVTLMKNGVVVVSCGSIYWRDYMTVAAQIYKMSCDDQVISKSVRIELVDDYLCILEVRVTETPCEAGTYHNVSGKCQECPVHTFSGVGARSCTPCDLGKVAQPGSVSRENCSYVVICQNTIAKLNKRVTLRCNVPGVGREVIKAVTWIYAETNKSEGAIGLLRGMIQTTALTLTPTLTGTAGLYVKVVFKDGDVEERTFKLGVFGVKIHKFCQSSILITRHTFPCKSV